MQNKVLCIDRWRFKRKIGRGVPRIIFIRSKFHFQEGGGEIFSPYFFSASGAYHTRWGAEYLITSKERLVLASAPYAPHLSFVHEGQKHNTLNLIRGMFKGGICHLCPTAVHASAQLNRKIDIYYMYADNKCNE